MSEQNTLADKYLKDGIDVEDFIRDITNNIGIVVTTSDITKPVGISIYADDFKKFLNTPLKPTLTEDEKVILRNINTQEYLIVERDKDEKCLFISKPCGIVYFGQYNHLFQFIQPRRKI